MFRRAIDEGFVDHQPATALGQFIVPVEQARRLDQAAGRVVGVDHQQHVQLRQGTVNRPLAELGDAVPFTTPGRGMFGIGRGDDADAACAAQARQGLDGRLRTRYRQQADGTVVLAGRLLQAVVHLRQTCPGRAGYDRQIPAIGGDTGGQIQPVLQGDAVALRRCAQSTSMFKQPRPPMPSGTPATNPPPRRRDSSPAPHHAPAAPGLRPTAGAHAIRHDSAPHRPG